MYYPYSLISPSLHLIPYPPTITGIPVTLLEVNQSKADAAKLAIESTYKSSSAYKSGKMTEGQVSQLLAKLTPTDRYSELSSVDLVIEAGYENMDVKKRIFSQLDQACKKEAILASNTSYLGELH